MEQNNLSGRQIRPLRLYFVRHGETAWSLSGQYSGRADIPLTANGELEARNLGPRLRAVRFDHVLTSPLRRARQTCALAGLPAVARIEPDLTEWDNGDYEGWTRENIFVSRPGWNPFRDGSPHGESPAQISARADRLIARLRLLAGNVALFSHGHFGRVFAARWVGLSVKQGQHFLLDTASISVLCYAHDRIDQPAIALWNAASPESLSPSQGGSTGENGNALRSAIERWESEGGELLNRLRPRRGQ